MKKRYHFYIVLGVLLVGFILGSFFDLQINQALFLENNAFGIGMAAFGVYPCYIGLSFSGGILFLVAFKNKEMPIWGKIICYFLSVFAVFMAVWLTGKEFASPNGLNNEKIKIYGYLIAAAVMIPVAIGSFFLCRKGDLKMLFRMAVLMVIIFTCGLLPPGFLIKLVIHRPRYRYMVRNSIGGCDFYNWWQSCSNYKDYIGLVDASGFEITKEEFKSFPSGHSGTGAIMMMFLPYFAMAFKKLRGKETLLFYIGFMWMLVMMFSRLTVGAHFLTDTCAGALFTTIVYFVVNEFAIRKKLFDDPVAPETPAEPQEA